MCLKEIGGGIFASLLFSDAKASNWIFLYRSLLASLFGRGGDTLKPVARKEASKNKLRHENSSRGGKKYLNTGEKGGKR
jgi:hypothetical protein